MTELQQCHTCRWGWHFDEELEPDFVIGECHRHAPSPVQDDDAFTYTTIWPRVSGASGCGDWTTRYL